MALDEWKIFELISKKNVINTKINKDLFEWVIENIIKNSIDAINEKGKVVITVKVNDKHIFIDRTLRVQGHACARGQVA